jgi:hypothetical protein
MSAALISELAYWRDSLSLHAEAIVLYEAAVESAPAASHEQGVALINLASASRDAAERTRQLLSVRIGKSRRVPVAAVHAYVERLTEQDALV